MAVETINASGPLTSLPFRERIEREASDDYTLVRRTIEYLSMHWQEQPELETIAAAVGTEAHTLYRTFMRWAGITPKSFIQALTLNRARHMLREEHSILDTAYELGLSGPGRLHDLFVTHEAMSPGAFKARGEGLTLVYGFHPSPFGKALLMTTDRGLAGLAFADSGEESRVLADMTARWPAAHFVESAEATASYARLIFTPQEWSAETPLRLVLIGSDFEVRVWETLLKIPFGGATSYRAIAEEIGAPKAARAVGGAVGRNPISFVVPCHRVVGANGNLCGYHWGLTRKKAILGWEKSILEREKS